MNSESQSLLIPDAEVSDRTAVERRIDAMKEQASKLERLGQSDKAKRLRSKVKMMERKYTSRPVDERLK